MPPQRVLPTPLSVPDLVEAQENSSRPRSASNVLVGAAFATSISPTASAMAAAGSRGTGSASASGLSRGGASAMAPMTASQLAANPELHQMSSSSWQQQQQQRRNSGQAGASVSPAFGTGSLPSLAAPSPTASASAASPSGNNVQARGPPPLTPDSLGAFAAPPPGSAAGGSVVDDNENSGSMLGPGGSGTAARGIGGGADSAGRHGMLSSAGGGGLAAAGSGAYVPVDDSAWPSEYDYIANQHLAQRLWRDANATGGDDTNAGSAVGGYYAWAHALDADSAEQASVAEPRLRALPAPYSVPFPGAREVRLDVQTMRVRMLQRGFVDPETVGGLRCSSSLSMASESRGGSAATATGTQNQHQQRPPQVPHPVPTTLPSNAGGGAGVASPPSAGASRFPLSSSAAAGLHQQHQQLQSKFRLCVWKYMPTDPAMGQFDTAAAAAARMAVSPSPPSSAAPQDGSARPNSSGNRVVRTPGGTVVSRWAMTPSSGAGPRPPAQPRNTQQQQQQQPALRAPAFMRLHRDVVFLALSFLATGELAVASQVCAAWFLLADPWVFLEHYGWVPLGPLSRATRVSLRLSAADDAVAPDVFAALSQSCEHLQLEFVGGVPMCDRALIPHLTRLKSLELLRPTQHDMGQIATSICAPLIGASGGSSNTLSAPSASAHRLHCLCINRASVQATQSNNFVTPLLALRAARLIIRRTVTLLPSALRLLSGSRRYPQMVIDRCIVLPTTEAPALANDEEEPQLLVSGIVDDTAPTAGNGATTAAMAGAGAAAVAAAVLQRPRSPPCELPCCNFFVDSALRAVRTPVAQMSRRRLYRLLVSQGRVATATSDEESIASSSRGGGGGPAASLYSNDSLSGGGGGARGDTPIMSAHVPPRAAVQQQVVVPQSLCIQCLIWERPCARHGG